MLQSWTELFSAASGKPKANLDTAPLDDRGQRLACYSTGEPPDHKMRYRSNNNYHWRRHYETDPRHHSAVEVEAVKEALNEVEVFRLTMVDVQGFGRQKGHSEVYRGHEFTVNLLRKVQLQIAVNEEFVEPTINAIIKAGRTGGRPHRRRQDLHPAAGGLHPHPHRRTRARSDLIG